MTGGVISPPFYEGKERATGIEPAFPYNALGLVEDYIDIKRDVFTPEQIGALVAQAEDDWKGQSYAARREPLLGDWLCEGDYGIIFASRGVGKTWLGLLIAKAVAKTD
jgi:hypothetical protein